MSVLSKRVGLVGLFLAGLLLLPGAAWLGKKGGGGGSLTGSDGNGARIEMDVNATGVTCGTVAGEQCCISFTQAATYPQPLVEFQCEGETMRLMETQIATTLLVDATMIAGETHAWWPVSNANNDGANSVTAIQGTTSAVMVPVGYVMIPLAVAIECTANMTTAGDEDCSIFFSYSNHASRSAADRSCEDPDDSVGAGCGDSTNFGLFQLGQVIQGATPTNDPIGVEGETGFYTFSPLFEVESWYRYLTFTRKYCTTGGEVCVNDAECAAIDVGDTCDLGTDADCDTLNGGIVTLFYLLIPDEA